MKSILVSLIIMMAGLLANAQPGLDNGSFDRWRGGQVSPGNGGTEKCCGQALAVPVYWGIPEQLMQMATNHFTFKEVDTSRIHSGYFSAQLYTDTTTFDSAGDVRDNIGLLVPGVVTCAGMVGYGGLGLTGDLYHTNAYSIGYPFSDSPVALHFYMMINHNVTDTARYAYAFTRWDSIHLKEDTLAVNDVEMPDDSANLPMNQWMLFTDSIHYRLAGLPDTLHMIFFGGKNADPGKIGNATWIDDVSFVYPPGVTDTGGVDTLTAVVKLAEGHNISVYPNPAANILNVRVSQFSIGAVIEIYNLTGAKVIRQTITSEVLPCDVSEIAEGIYCYRLLDRNSNCLESGKFAIAR